MSRWNPYIIGYSQDENKVTALLLHVLEETRLTGLFLTFLLENEKISAMQFELQAQLHGNFNRKVSEAFILGLSETGAVDATQIVSSKNGDPDAVFYSNETGLVVFLESKINEGELTNDQLSRHKGRLPDLNANDIPVINKRWENVITFFERYVQTTNEKNNYIINNFINFLKLVGIGYRDINTIYYKGRRFNEVPRAIHDFMLMSDYEFEFNPGNLDVVEYRYKGRRISALDVVKGRFILKFGSSNESYRQELLNQIRAQFGANYHGTYENVKGEVNIPLESVSKDNFPSVIVLIDKILKIRRLS